jgi:hypothetical protein
MSSSFSVKCRSFETLNVLTQWGLSPCACQMRRTLDSLTLATAAIRRVLQWVAFAGGSCVVISTIRLTLRTEIAGVLPGRGASCSMPRSPCAMQRARQRATVRRPTFSSAPTALSVSPLAARKIICARSANRTATRRPVAQDCNCLRCSSVNSIFAATRILSPSVQGDTQIVIKLIYL